MADPVEYESRGPVVTLWLNRPEVKNAYDLGLLEARADGLTRAEEDEDARLVVVSGRGDGFCAYVEHYDFINRLGSEHGTYFGRVVSHPGGGGEAGPQLEHTIEKLERAKTGKRCKAIYEVNIYSEDRQALWR